MTAADCSGRPAADGRGAAADGDVRSHTDSVRRTCMKRFSKMFSVTELGAVRLSKQGHELGLHVGGKAGVLFGGDVGGA